MSLNCLKCQDLQKTNSENETKNGLEKHYRNICCVQVERSWSGNLSPQPYEKIGSGSLMVAKKKKVKNGPRRHSSTGGVAFEGSGEPKLVRSCGMRRDWSFENLRERENKRRGWSY